MKIIDPQRHEQCHYFDASDKPGIELIKIVKGEKCKLDVKTNKVIFFMEGHIRYVFNDSPSFEGKKGGLLFLPGEGDYSCYALSAAVLMVFRIHEPIRLCDNLSLEKLYALNQGVDTPKEVERRSSLLQINTRMWHFLAGIRDSLTDGVRCRNYFELKVRELFLLLRFYYTKEEIYNFLYPIASGDPVFSEYVRRQWRHFHSVDEIADSMHLTSRQFSARFKSIFGQTAARWMIENRAKLIFRQLKITNKPIKQVAIENGFHSMPQFTKFCKKELGETPTGIRSGQRNVIRCEILQTNR